MSVTVGFIVLVTKGGTKLREVPWHKSGKESRQDQKPVIWAVY